MVLIGVRYEHGGHGRGAIVTKLAMQREARERAQRIRDARGVQS